ncbi:hypothetical protein [Oryzomonas rubra]|uniref:hypothetical protein n=1 Tax=Oryzomonas rubra TaxID=2509454 RepID=UPI00165DCF96|nr:hypothetical protein [Oryzomonas rubra]
MTREELAAQLDGSEYPLQLSRELKDQIKAAGLVVVYGASDDLMEFDGALYDEFGCYNGGHALLDAAGLLPDWENVKDSETEAYALCKRRPFTRSIKAIWGQGDYSWQYETDIPHVTFEIMEDGEKYCRGMVFELSALVVPDPAQVAEQLQKAVEFAGYMATAAEHYQTCANRHFTACDCEDPDQIEKTGAVMGDAYNALTEAIFEFRKRLPA